MLRRASSGLSRCKSYLSSGGRLYVNVEVKKQEQTIFKTKKRISLPSLPGTSSLQQVGSRFSALRRGVSGLGISLSKTLGEASETIRETRRGSSGLGDNWDDTKSFFRSFKNFGSGGFPSPDPIPQSWRNPFSGMSGVSSSYGADAKDFLRGSGEVFGAAGSQAGEALGDWARSVRQSASEWRATAWISR